jgi:hypothetical protein
MIITRQLHIPSSNDQVLTRITRRAKHHSSNSSSGGDGVSGGSSTSRMQPSRLDADAQQQ